MTSSTKRWFSLRNMPFPGRFLRLILMVFLGGTIIMTYSDLRQLAREMAERTTTAKVPARMKGQKELTENPGAPTKSAGPPSLRRLFDDVKTYVIFIGHSRSGHSIVGSLLDAHPEVIVTHEHGTKWNLFQEGAEKGPKWDAQKLLFYFRILERSRFQATFGLRADKPPKVEGTNYTYNYFVRGQWQGQFRDKITVMGDKSGHFTAEYFRNADNMKRLEFLPKNLGVSLKIIHVLRNPFDVLATRILRAEEARESASEDNKVKQKKEDLDSFISGYFGRTEAIARIRDAYDVLDIPGDELVQQPQASMRKICRYVGITCEQDYIDACADLLHKKPSITRRLVEWDEEGKRKIQQEIDRFPFLKHYSFDSFP